MAQRFDYSHRSVSPENPDVYVGGESAILESNSSEQIVFRMPYIRDTGQVVQFPQVVSFESPSQGGSVDGGTVVYLGVRPGENSPPTADAGLPQTVLSGSQVTLDGSGSSDPDEDPLTYLWQAPPWGSPVTLEEATSAIAHFTAPLTEGQRYLFFNLEVSDGTETDTDGVEVVVVSELPETPTPTITEIPVSTATATPTASPGTSPAPEPSARVKLLLQYALTWEAGAEEGGSPGLLSLLGQWATGGHTAPPK